MHISDFSGDEGIVDQYKENQDWLCKNSARLTFLVEPTLPDDELRFFSPPVEYDNGSIVNPDQGIDRFTNAYPDYTDMTIRDTRRRMHARDIGRRSGKLNGIKNNQPGKLVVSGNEQYSAVEVCGNANSLGADFVSLKEKKMCNMETGKVWALCDDDHKIDYFDLKNKTFLVHGKRGEDSSIPEKKYDNGDPW
ncbi:Hypothetical protein D9617_21g096620 [Elsinoe fawcettii]|nr:Hypothetical protein D9617_21g096620 [Elsinoe fawcettii]